MAWSSELLCFSPRTRDHWLPRRARAGRGLAILTGVLFRVGAACIINLVIGAIFLVHISHGFDVGKSGFECAFAQLLIAFSILLTGPGAYSLAGILPPPLLAVLLRRLNIARQDASASLTKCSTASKLGFCLYRERCD
jgi:hypothetical protein